MGAPAVVESRVACPACGGLVHPIAGRCKHCKVDLTRRRDQPGAAARAARPQLVALGGGASPAAAPPAHDGHGPRGAVGPTAARITAAEPDDGDEPARGGSARWPLVVAGVAILAIVASLAMLLFGDRGGTTSSRAKKFEGPAPELTPIDPHATPTPTTPNPNMPTTPPPLGGTVPPPSPDLQDPFAPPPAPPPRSGGLGTVDAFLLQAVETGCRRLSSCGGVDPVLTQLCATANQQLRQMTGMLDSMCTDYDAGAARQCLDSIARFPCPSGTADPTSIATTVLSLSTCQKVCPSAFAGLGGSLGGSLGLDPDPVAPDDPDAPDAP